MDRGRDGVFKKTGMDLNRVCLGGKIVGEFLYDFVAPLEDFICSGQFLFHPRTQVRIKSSFDAV